MHICCLSIGCMVEFEKNEKAVRAVCLENGATGKLNLNILESLLFSFYFRNRLIKYARDVVDGG
jgi:hypothetical protein